MTGNDVTRADVATRTRRAAADWLDSLTDEQRRAGWWAGPDDASAERERLRWFYTPTDHGGLPIGDQRPAQQQLVMRLLAAGLSREGYVTVATVIGWEDVLDTYEG